MKTTLSAILASILHDEFISCGQILSPDAIAEIIAKFEGEENIEPLSADEIRQAIYSASDAFVDSMQGNCLDTWNDQGCKGKPGEWLDSENAFNDQMAHYESMRPANQRKAQIIASLSAPAPALSLFKFPLSPEQSIALSGGAEWRIESDCPFKSSALERFIPLELHPHSGEIEVSPFGPVPRTDAQCAKFRIALAIANAGLFALLSLGGFRLEIRDASDSI